MGNQITSANRDTALKATLPVRKVCDQILVYMLKEINIKDFYLLATKRECSRYVIFLANQMNKTFRSLSFAPARGPGGVLFFQPIDILEHPSKEQETERQSLCLFLAYFYVRIFQIYGSLALTLVDDANVYVKFKSDAAGMERGFRTEEEKRYGIVGAPNPLPGRWAYARPEPLEREGPIYPYAPGRDAAFRLPGDRDRYGTRRRERDPYGRGRDLYGYTRRRRDDSYSYDALRPRYRGGAALADDKLGKFKFFRKKLDSETVRARIVDELDIKKNIGHRFLSGIDAAFKLKSDEFKTDRSRMNEGSLFIATSKGRTRFYELKLEVVGSDGNSSLRVTGVRYQSLLDEALMSSRVRFAGRTTRSDIDTYRIREIMRRAFGSENGDVEIVQSGADEYKFETSLGLQTFSEFMKSLKEQFDYVVGIRKTSDRLDRDGRRNTRRATGEVIDSNLKIVDTLTYLQEKKPLAHCIARGLQLLGNKNPDGTFTPAVCETKFLISKRDTDEKVANRTDVPDPGGKVLTGGLKSLANLFYDTLVIKSHKLIQSNRAINDYIIFMQRMVDIFLDPTAGETTNLKDTLKEVGAASLEERKNKINHPEFMKLENLSDSQMAALCKGLNVEKMHPRSPEGRGVLEIVGKLFGRQIIHAANCGNILRQLFTTVSINGTVSVRINQNVFIKGVAELNRINDLTRQLLIGYYTDCEGLYKVGVKVVKEGMDRKGAVAEMERAALIKMADTKVGGGKELQQFEVD
jgi:hypothetical protein